MKLITNVLFSSVVAGINTCHQSIQAQKNGFDYTLADGLKNFSTVGFGTGLTLELGSQVISSFNKEKEPSDTDNYFLCDVETPVYTGITFEHRKKDTIRRHTTSDKEFTHIVFCNDLKPRSEARKLETEIIVSHKNSGQKLKYNKQHNK